MGFAVEPLEGRLLFSAPEINLYYPDNTHIGFVSTDYIDVGTTTAGGRFIAISW